MATLVLIPGLLCNEILWRDQLSALRNNVEIRIAKITQQSTISEMALWVLNNAPERFALAGFSLGSQVALEIMKTAGYRVHRLALLSATEGGLLSEAKAAIGHAVGVIEAGCFDKYLDEAYPSYFADHGADNARLKGLFLTMAHTVGPDAGLRQMRALLQVQAPLMDLHRIECPTLIIGGRLDRRTTPEAHQTLARGIPGSRLVIIGGAAHFTPIEKPRVVSEAMGSWMEGWS